MTGQRVLGVAGLVVGLAITVLLGVIWIDLTLKLREGPGLTTPFALAPPAVALIGDIVVTVMLIQLVRHRQSLATMNIVVWGSNAISFVLLEVFGVR